MLFCLFGPVPHVTVGMREMADAVAASHLPLPDGATDPAWHIARDALIAADKAGFDVVLYAERHHGTDLEAFMLAAAMAPQTSRIRHMVAVHPGLWPPQLVAKMLASLDRMSPGRAALNLVTGWNVREARMYGGDVMLEDDERYVRAEEFVTVLRGMWSTSPFSFKGKYYDVDSAELLLRPASRKLPEVFTASRSPRGLDMVARAADWWFLSFDKEASTTAAMMESARRAVADMRERADKAGRRVRIAFNPFVHFGPTREAAMADAQRLLSPDWHDADVRKMTSRIGPSMMAGCVGTPAQVRDQLAAYEEIGIELVLLQFVPSVEMVERIGAELISPTRRAA